jgi:hypothetical protein
MNQVTVIETDAVVATMSRARSALAEAKTIQETKRIVDAAAAAEIYARRQKLGEEASDLAISIKVEALRKLGEMLKATPRAPSARGSAGPGRGKNGVPVGDSVLGAPTLTELGLTKRESAVAQKLAAMPESEFQQVRDGHITVSKAIAAVDATKSSRKSAAVPPSPAPAPVTHLETPDGEVIDLDEVTPSTEELIAELQKENEQLRSQLETLMADDTKAELHKMILQRDHAVRQQAEAMDRAHGERKRHDFKHRQLMRCGKAVGETDPDKIAPAVEAFVRQFRKAA